MLYERKTIRMEWALEEVMNRRIQRRWLSLKQVPEIVGKDIVLEVTIN